MSAIAAAHLPDPSTAEAVLGRMVAAAPHRGDRVDMVQEGSWAVAAITHPDQPEAAIAREDGWAVAFTGRLENAAEVIAALMADRTASIAPAHVVLMGFRRWGEAAPLRLRGPFAAVVTDGRTAWLFRDHVGLETLFYRRDAHGFFAATEAKQVAAGAGLAAEPDVDVVEQIFFHEYDDRTPAAVRGVLRLPKATILRSDGRDAATATYWRPEHLLETWRPTSVDEIKEAFDETMARAVDRAFNGDDVVLLSGGIDAPTVAAFGAERHLVRFARPLRALSWVFPDHPSVDESAMIAEAAGAFQLPIETFQPRPPSLDDLEEHVRLFDGPWPAWSSTSAFETYERVRAGGSRTVLSGMFAEFVVEMQQDLTAHLVTHGRLVAAIRHLRLQRRSGVRSRWLARQAMSAFVPGWAMALYSGRWRPTRVPRWVDETRVRVRNAQHERSPRDRWRYAQLSGFRGPGLGQEASSICQAVVGVRERYPWADVDVWELFLRLPADIKFPEPHSKALVRQLLRGHVPDPILDQRRKVVHNEFHIAGFDYPALRKFLVSPPIRLRGVDYELLEERLEAEDLALDEYIWAKDLATAHAFLTPW
jgi:asparagine synthetase B (glutamine-hydrolysing)